MVLDKEMNELFSPKIGINSQYACGTKSVIMPCVDPKGKDPFTTFNFAPFTNLSEEKFSII